MKRCGAALFAALILLLCAGEVQAQFNPYVPNVPSVPLANPYGGPGGVNPVLMNALMYRRWPWWRRPYPFAYPMFFPYPVNTSPPSPPPAQPTNNDAPPTDNRAHISIELPTYVTDVWVDDEKMESKIALERLFITPTLEPGHTYTYTIKVRFVRRGENVTEQRVVHVRANEVTRVSFAAATAAVSAP